MRLPTSSWLSSSAFFLALAGCAALPELLGTLPLFAEEKTPLPPAGWSEKAQERIEDMEYRITWQQRPVAQEIEPSWQAPNRAQNLRSYFTREGVRVVPRTGSVAWRWGLELLGYGRGGTTHSVESGGAPSARGNRVDYFHGGIGEWFVNEPRGLEQGFVLSVPPERMAGSDASGSVPRLVPEAGAGRKDREHFVHLEMRLTGDLSPAIGGDGQVIEFKTRDGVRALRYAELRATDARGASVPAWMEGFSGPGLRGVRLVLDDRDAAYPITIDPLATSPSWVVDGDQAGASFGTSVSTAGDVNGDGYSDVIVGAYAYDNGETDEGRVFVYLGSAAGLSTSWSWSAEGNEASAFFGYAVAAAGDVNGDGYGDVIVGAYGYDNGQIDEGGAYVYLGSASGLAAAPVWVAEGDQTSAYYGFTVAGAGDVNGDGYSDVIVGAYGYDNDQTDEGRAYVYLGSPAGPAPAPSWTAEGDQAGAYYGVRVSTAGDVNGDGYDDVIVGAMQYDNGQTDEGRAYVYLGSASGLAAAPSWSAEGDQASANFGVRVSTAGDVNGDGYADVIVGAWRYDNDQTDEGRAYVYLGSASGLAATPVWTAEGNQTGASFGYTAASAGDVNGDGYADILVGALYYTSSYQQEGRVSLYLGSASGPAAVAAWSAVPGQAYANMGSSLGTAGDVNGDGYSDVIVGAPNYDGAFANTGRAYVYLGSATGLALAPGWWTEGNQASAYYGSVVSSAGDVNGDGYDDVLVGAPNYDNGETDEGKVFLYAGSAAGLLTAPLWTAEGNQAGALFGTSAAGAGDVNGDGYADIIIGAPSYDNLKADEGRAVVYLGSTAGPGAAPAWTMDGGQAGAQFGASVASAGDVNGDGYADVVIGAPSYDNGQLDEGRAYVYQGSASGLSPSPGWIAESNQGGAHFGNSVASAGDVNGDSFDDVVVGAYQFNSGLGQEGKAFVYLGSSAGLAAAPDWSYAGNEGALWLGFSVASAGDVNGDGYADVLIGADELNGGNRYGRAYLFLGIWYGLSPAPAWNVGGDLNDRSEFGRSVASAGDVNGDGYADVVVGCPWYYDSYIWGRVYVYLGSATGLSTAYSWHYQGDQSSGSPGYSVASAGDVNGDGFADVLAGAPYYDAPDLNEGRAYLFYGNGGAGRGAAPQQIRADGSAPLPHGGVTSPVGDLRLRARGRSPFGRGRAKLEWEIKPAGEPFDGTGLEESPGWDAVDPGGAPVDGSLSSLSPGFYHWRVRERYDPSTTPGLPAGRWLTSPLTGPKDLDFRVSLGFGGFVWDDKNADGIREAGEPPLASLPVYLLDASRNPVALTLTAADGSYLFNVPTAGQVAMRVAVPTGYLPTLQDQGTDDLLDSDVDPITDETMLVDPWITRDHATRWSAGLRRIGPCDAPDEPIYIYMVRLSTDGNDYPILDFTNPNQPSQYTGYNVYRSSDPALSPGSWSLVATDVVDAFEDVANNQWVDVSGDVSPTGLWFYKVAAYNDICDLEGPW